MRVVCVLGSPRKKGNSAVIADRFCRSAEKLGADVRTYVLNDLEYRGCQGCMACKTSHEHCVLQDDLTAVLEAVREADVVVLASPVYFWDVTSQTKSFLDRTFSYLVPNFMTASVRTRLSPGKKLVFIQTQGNPDESLFANIFPKFDYFFKANGFSETHLIRACGVREPGEVEAQEAVMSLAEETAKSLCRSR